MDFSKRLKALDRFFRPCTVLRDLAVLARDTQLNVRGGQ
jgi:hypothetical protein